MTEHETMNTIIHAALRRDLLRFDEALGAFPAGSRKRADQLTAAWNNYAYQVHHHHQDEETIFWPVAREHGAEGSLVDDLAGEHAQMLTALDAADASMKVFGTDPTAENTTAARSSIAELGGVVEDHLAHEERDMEPIFATQQGTPQFKAAQKTVRKAHKGNTGTFFAWLLDGAAPETKAALYREIPPPVVFIASRVAGRDYTRRIAAVWA